MSRWFLDEASAMKRISASGSPSAIPVERIETARTNADRWSMKGYAAENLCVANGCAIIYVERVLLAAATLIDEYLGLIWGETYTTYPGLIAQLRAAESDPSVNSIILNFDTPGGMVAGLDEAAQILAGCGKKKKTTARIGWMAASAGYYLASQCNESVAMNETSSVGSSGTIVSLIDATGYYEKLGVKFYTISSSNAPRKAPAEHSEEFKKEVQMRVDYLANIFVERVAEGRSAATGKTITKDEVEMNFGRGSLVFAKAAMAAGMIDAIGEAALQSNQKEDRMSAEVKGAAFEDGIKQERSRVCSLLPWMAADSEKVIAAIKDGSELTPEMVADLSTKAAEKAIADAKAKAAKEDEARVAAEAAQRQADAAPVVATVDVEDKAALEKQEHDALLARVMKKSKTGGN